MDYTEFKKQNSDLLTDFPVFFAFSDEQLTEGLKKLGAEKEEIVNIGAGGFLKRTDRKAFDVMFKKFETGLQENLKNKAFFCSAFIYELGNHEYGYTYDLTDTMESLDLDFDELTEEQKLWIKDSTNEYLRNCED